MLERNGAAEKKSGDVGIVVSTAANNGEDEDEKERDDGRETGLING